MLAAIIGIAGAAGQKLGQNPAIGNPVPAAAIVGVALFPLAVLGLVWLSTHFSRAMRCHPCAQRWRVHSIFALEPVHPALVLLTMLFIVLQYFVIPGLRTEASHWVHLGLVTATLLVVILLSRRLAVRSASAESEETPS
ncbi:MAG: hypothetical protein O7H41_09495 [Planctomycetota bacterium]|nr:hypothetical protein [Planctomycetota bacterium]